MRDFSDRSPSTSEPNPASNRKRLGGYLVEAGLLTPGQVDVALNDQKLTGMRFGEILAARGWVKQQTIEYLMKKVVLPEQQQIAKRDQARNTTLRQDRTLHQSDPLNAGTPALRAGSLSTTAVSEENKQSGRRDIPISKPLPSVNTSDGDVSWVG
ncbi:hypothetical protein K9N68_00845 [Kovacikia minuta CCNUW1]|uniref:hypothetical protein n=1 Tax=Kovacikia minuta TaxID=2931930 RepID=UPI001CCE8016|nr:hypothetical protein [Kovacikia minuta]UBF26593.1 hypothetical protein K9N68_00845 [Kovacikia minuta CCNUW1]